MFLRQFIFPAVAVIAFSLASCSTYKNIDYLQDAQPNVSDTLLANKGIVIQPKDMISIIVSSRNNELAIMFNLPVVSYQAGSEIVSSSYQKLTGYVVDNEGFIDFPVLGRIPVGGMTRWELSRYIKDELISRNLVLDPVITVEFLNFKVSVLGEVNAPGTYTVDGDKITILQALSLAHDLTIFGRRDNVSVVREQNGQRTVYQMDLRSVDMFNSPAYYLQQNDVVYVYPNKVRAGQSTINENNIKSVSLWVSVGSFFTTVATLVISVLANSAKNSRSNQ